MKLSDFPKDFLWGASASGHQLEGSPHSQWTAWEKANAVRLAAEAPKRNGHLANWPDIQAQATNPSNYRSGDGVEHYTRYKRDFDFLEKLNLNAFRFGIDWSRIEPHPGKWDQAALDHYRDYIAELRQRNIEPIPTLWHWAMPTWFTDKGGFERRANLADFDRFVSKIAEEFGDGLNYILTLNEPNVYASISYFEGRWPPQRKSLRLMFRVHGNLMRAHRRAYAILKQANPQLQVGVANHLENSQPLTKRWYNRPALALINYVWNWWFLDRVRHHQDFIGVNNYFTSYYNWRGKRCNPGGPVNDMGWYMEPGGLEPLVRSVYKRYQLPIIITESGVADAKDQYRQWWIEECLKAMQRLLHSRVDVRGYLHWSLLDNFEWSDGWWPKFGLVAVDHKTMKRSVRPSARWFAGQIKR